METRANYIAVGLMTLLAIVAAFFAIYWVGKFDAGDAATPLNVRIKGSVSGLASGSTVQFNGIDIGRVVGLQLDESDPRFVIIQTEVRSDIPLRSDTKASIGTRGLAGGAFVQLEGGTPSQPQLLQASAPGQRPPSIDGDPSSINELVATVNAVAARTDRILTQLEEVVEANTGSVNATLKNAEVFSKALADNADGVDRLLASAESMAKSVESLSTKLDGTIARAEQIVTAINPADVRSTLDDVAATAKSTRAIVGAVDVATVQGVVERLDKASEQAGKIMAAIDTANINRTVEQISETVTQARQITQDVGKVTDKLASRSDEIDTMISNASQLTARLNASSTKIDGVLDKADEIMTAVDTAAVRALITQFTSMGARAEQLIAAVDPAKVDRVMQNAIKASEGANTIVTDVNKVTSRFAERSDDIDAIVTDASQLTSRLNETSKKIDGVIARVDNLLGSGEANGLVADVRSTLAEFRNTARNFNSQIATVASGINSFTKRGLGDTQGLISDVRQSIGKIDRVITNLERNPSSLITGRGGSRIRESSGRPRR